MAESTARGLLSTLDSRRRRRLPQGRASSYLDRSRRSSLACPSNTKRASKECRNGRKRLWKLAPFLHFLLSSAVKPNTEL